MEKENKVFKQYIEISIFNFENFKINKIEKNIDEIPRSIIDSKDEEKNYRNLFNYWIVQNAFPDHIIIDFQNQRFKKGLPDFK